MDKKFVDEYKLKVPVIQTVQRTVTLSLREYCGQRIRQLRKEKNITQQDIEKHTGLLRTSLSNIELGKQGLTMDLLNKFCQIFECKSTDILPF